VGQISADLEGRSSRPSLLILQFYVFAGGQKQLIAHTNLYIDTVLLGAVVTVPLVGKVPAKVYVQYMPSGCPQ
jgi:hypothetical protein